jgi:hypothetical protein
MAEIYSPEEINEIFEAYNRAIREGTPITADLAKQFKNASIGVKNYTETLNKSLKDLGTSALKYAENLKDGAQGSAVFNDGIKAGADAIDAFASRFGILGRIIGGLATAGAKYAIEVNKQSDALYKSYQDLTRFGQGTASGMSDVFDTMQKFSYGIAELDQMTALLRENAKSLALFGGTVAQGTDVLANTAVQFKDSGLQEYFMRMGVSVDNQNRAIAGYVKQLGMLGQVQGKTQAELTQGAADYLRQMEGLTRLTGQTREEMEQQRAAAMRVDQFAVTAQKLDKRARDEAYKVVDILSSIDPKLAQGFEEGFSGFLTNSAEQNQLFQLSGGQILALTEQLKQGRINAGQFLDAIAPKGNQLKTLQSFAELPGVLSGFAGSYSNVIKLTNRSWEKSAETADGQTEVTDRLTDSATELRKKQVQTRDAFQSMINDGVVPATKAMAKLAGITDQAAEGSKGFWDKVGDFFSGKKSEGTAGPLLDLIGKGESGGNYNKLVGGKTADLTSMTIAQVLEFQKNMTKANGFASTAVGKYQMISSTLQEQARKAGLDIQKTKFDQKTQDLLAMQLVKEAGYGRKDDATVMGNLAKTWASLPKDMSGRGAYDGFNGNRATINPKDLSAAIQNRNGSAGPVDPNVGATMPAADQAALDAIRQSQKPLGMATGFEGLLSGPKSGYRPNIVMHGTESIKVTPENQLGQSDAPPMHSMINQQTAKLDQMVQALQDSSNQDMMMMQLDKLDQLISVMKNQVNVSQKILQQTH